MQTQHWDALPYQAGAGLAVVNPNGPVESGDTLILHTGNHGNVLIQGAHNAQPIQVRAAAGAAPRLERLWLRSASNWRFDGVHILPLPGGNPASGPLLRVETHAHHGPSMAIEVINSVVRSAATPAGWNAQTWIASAYDGIIVDGPDHVIRGNRFEVVRHGISVNGPNALVDGNQVTDFSGDGMRGLGDGGTFQYNLIRNNYAVDENHDDGFQSWARDSGVVRDITLRGNVFIDHSDPNQPLRGILQGIGCFDGFYEGWLVENNVMLVEHAHGITLLGARDSLIINNTAHNPFGGGPGPAWIRIDNHKDGRASQGVVVRNNLVDALVLGNGVAGDSNIIVEQPEQFYVDPMGDMRLRAGAPAIDAGNAQDAPGIDQAGVARPQGAGVDVGAFEWRAAGEPEPTEPEPTEPEPTEPEPMEPEPGEPDPKPLEPEPTPTEPEPPTDAGLPDATPGVRMPEAETSAGASSGCASSGAPTAPMGWLLFLGLVGIRRQTRAA